MIDIKDLRIGNILLINGIERKLASISEYKNQITYVLHGCTYAQGIASTGAGFIKPIVITKELLLIFGFKKCNDLDCWYNIRIRNDWTRLNVNIKHEMAEIEINKHHCVLGSMKYVHQLQNLYHALTGEEINFDYSPQSS